MPAIMQRCTRCQDILRRSRNRRETMAKQAGYCKHCFSTININTALA